MPGVKQERERRRMHGAREEVDACFSVHTYIGAIPPYIGAVKRRDKHAAEARAPP
jgi:hypothetical protein